MLICDLFFDFFFFKQKTAYEMRISDWSSDVCSSDLVDRHHDDHRVLLRVVLHEADGGAVGDLLGSGIPLGILARTEVRLVEHRSEERRVGKACVSTCRSRWSPYH